MELHQKVLVTFIVIHKQVKKGQTIFIHPCISPMIDGIAPEEGSVNISDCQESAENAGPEKSFE